MVLDADWRKKFGSQFQKIWRGEDDLCDIKSAIVYK